MKTKPNDTIEFYRNLEFLSILSLFILGIIARMDTRMVTPDMEYCFIPWYRHIRDAGLAVALRENFTNYTPIFSYLLAVTTLLDSIIPKVMAIKLIPITADLISTFFIYKIVRLKFPKGIKPYFAASLFFILPTVFINSAHWGQVDALYTMFIIISLFFFLKDKSFLGMLAYALSFSIKFQAIFFVPFLVVLLLKKKILWWQFFLIPAVYVLTCLPVVLLGRSWQSVLSIYLGQAGSHEWLSANAPNLYIFISDNFYRIGLIIGLVFASCSLATWIIFTFLDKREFTKEKLVLLALISVSITPFVLPKMHERYFYPADALSLIVAFFLPDLWFVPIAFQASSSLAYSVYLFGASVGLVKIGAIINTVLIAYLLFYQFSKGTNSLNKASEHENI